MNRFYNYIISLLFLTDFLIAYGIISSAFFNKIELMMGLRIFGDVILLLWGLLFVFSLLGVIFYRHKIISFKAFIASIFAIIISYYLTYLCQYTHTPDLFTSDDLIWSTKRFILYFPKEYYWLILQGISYIISIIVKDKKKLKGLKTNLIISLIRFLFLLICFTVYFMSFFRDDVLGSDFGPIFLFILIFSVYFIISCIIEFGIDFVIKKCSNTSLE